MGIHSTLGELKKKKKMFIDYIILWILMYYQSIGIMYCLFGKFYVNIFHVEMIQN